MMGSVAGGIAGMKTFDELFSEGGVPFAFDFKFKPFSAAGNMLDASQLGEGWAMATAKCTSALKDTQRYKLAQFCTPGTSNPILLRCPNNETDADGLHIWHTYQCVMLWPTDYETRTVFIDDTDPGYWEQPTFIFQAFQQQD